MKLITLNAYGGIYEDKLLEFINKYSDTDIFCFQEIFNNLDENVSTSAYIYEDTGCKQIFNKIETVLKNHNGYFLPHLEHSYGLAIFIKKGIEVVESGEKYISINENYDPNDDYSDHSRKLQWIKIINNSKPKSILNIHGLWAKEGKVDNENRIEQSRLITSCLKQFDNISKIACGDFNLRPDTLSVKIIEEHGLINHISKNNITSTRTKLYKKEERFADYIFTSPEIEVRNFEVIENEASDHSALYMEFD